MRAGLQEAAGDPEGNPYARVELEGLIALVARAQSARRYSLTYRCLL